MRLFSKWTKRGKMVAFLAALFVIVIAVLLKFFGIAINLPIVLAVALIVGLALYGVDKLQERADS